MTPSREPPPFSYIETTQFLHMVTMPDPEARRVHVGAEGSTVPAKLFARLVTDDVGAVDLTIETDGGRSRVSSITITETQPGAGVTASRLEHVPLQQMAEHAIRVNIWPSDGADFLKPDNESRWEKETRNAVRRRTALTDERLTAVLADYEEGGIDLLVERHFVSDRQAYRLLKEARARRDAPK